MTQDIWGIVLAGGQGRRLAAVTGGVPKQYFAPRRGPTLIESTIRRLEPIVGGGRLATVIDVAHEGHLAALAARTTFGTLVRQPMDRGTAAGVRLGLSALAAQPTDLVVLTPADHAFADVGCFQLGIRRAADAVRGGRADVVLFAAEPSAPAADLGWVRPLAGRRFQPDRLARIGRFAEKPHPADARALFESGAAWNTMVLVSRIDRLLELYWRHLPDVARAFAQAEARPARSRLASLTALYPALRPTDFSRDLLGPASGLHAYLWPAAAGWTDLGTPARLEAWLSGRRQAPSAPVVRWGDAAAVAGAH